MAVLRDYPLRLWAEQNEYFDGLLREFSLLVIGEQSRALTAAAPGRLLELADLFQNRYGALLQTINDERRQALDRGLDRLDLRLPLIEALPDLLASVRQVLDEADDFCRQGDLLTLPRPEALRRFSDWVRAELLTQYDGGPPTPWPGPF